MTKINRNTFLKQSLSVGALTLLGELPVSLLAQNTSKKAITNLSGDDILSRLVVANDNSVATVLKQINTNKFTRRTGFEFAALSASYCSATSRYFGSKSIISSLEKLAELLLKVQSEDGTMDLGNLESPPDTAFLLEPVTAAAFILKKNPSADVIRVNDALKKFILKAGKALRTGGVHTPNHRWVICAAMARVNELYPDQKYIARIEDWLGEGVFIDKDGHYPERSMNYGTVENNSLITMSRLLNKPSLLEPVRRNLRMTYYYMEPDGDLVTTDSRRQDQYSSKSIFAYYLHYRYVAVKDNNGTLGAIAKLIENMKGFEEEVLSRSLVQFLQNTLLQKELPVGAAPPDQFHHFFSTSNLLRIRNGNTTTTLFGGNDFPIIIASGRSDSPNFYSYRKGKAILKYMRLSTSFFSTGYFYSGGIKQEGNRYILHKKLEVPYYQPLPKKLRKASGDYQLSESIDGRFWNKMDFKHRPVSNVKTLETNIFFVENNGKNEITFLVTGQANVQVTIELCFNEGGKLSSVSDADNGNYFLEKGFGKYQCEGDTIQFGPGAVAGKVISSLEGERYSTHFGSLRTEGIHVYLTGITPFKHTLNFS